MLKKPVHLFSMRSQFLIGAISSGGGKTTLTLGLLRALKNRGLNIQSFKCGPDYIDTKFHQAATGNPSVNLDTFLSSPEHVDYLFKKYSADKEVCIAEGVMGLFDGYDRMKGSSAEIADMLNLPVILVLNAKSMAYSVAPILYGFKQFCKDVHLAGVIFNFVGSESHYRFLKDACEDVGVEPLGYLPQRKEIETPSRHLGLSLEREALFNDLADEVAALAEKTIDIDRLLEITQTKRVISIPTPKTVNKQDLKIAIARDEAFNFVYHENIEYLKQLGDITFFSPIHDATLPPADFIYLPGGYPELYLKELSANADMLKAIRQYAEQGGKLLAECGGMMYLSNSITDQNGTVYPMVGLFDQYPTMEKMKLKLGYRQFQYNTIAIKGHEFHYSHTESHLDSVAQQYTAKHIPVDTKLLRYKNVIAGYTHIYWAEMNNLLDLFK